MITGTRTDYEFIWGSAEVTRLASDDKKGWVLMEINTPKEKLQVYVTKTGKVRIHNKNNKELLTVDREG